MILRRTQSHLSSSSLPSPSYRPSTRVSVATALVLTALLLTTTFFWLFLIFSSHHVCPSTKTSTFSHISSPFPWQPLDFYDSDPLLLPSRRPINASHVHLRNIMFGIAGSAQLWPKRREFIKLWWKPLHMRGFVWLDELLNDDESPDSSGLPSLIVSQDTSSFSYTHPTGDPSGIRIARILIEMFRMDLPDVHWFVLADDDTVFSVENLVRVLSKYDPDEMYYIGGYSESHYENFIFSYNMAYGGGGVAISYPLAEALVGMLDFCIQRYPQLFGSDDRLHACITELGVPITKEPGFHQFDVRGSAFGLLAAHPVAPFVSLHHVEMVDPFFPDLGTLDSLHLLVKAMQVEPSSFLQQAICYQPKHKLSFSISLGYAVQVFPKIISPRELQKPERTFKAWNWLDLEAEFDINTRPSALSMCDRPYIFFLEEIHIEEGTGQVISTYKRHYAIDEHKKKSFCWSHTFSPVQVQYIRAISKPLDSHWYLVPRRQCCTAGNTSEGIMDVLVETCQQGIAIS